MITIDGSSLARPHTATQTVNYPVGKRTNLPETILLQERHQPQPQQQAHQPAQAPCRLLSPVVGYRNDRISGDIVFSQRGMVWQNPKKWQACSSACANTVIHHGFSTDNHPLTMGSHSQAELMIYLVDEIIFTKPTDCFGRSRVNQASRGDDRFLLEKTLGSYGRYECSLVSWIEIVAADYSRIPLACVGYPE